MHRAPKIILKPEDRKRLEEVYHSEAHSARMRLRARVIILASSLPRGRSPQNDEVVAAIRREAPSFPPEQRQFAEELSAHAVGRCRRRFGKRRFRDGDDGLDSLRDRPRKPSRGSPKKKWYTPSFRKKVLAAVKERAAGKAKPISIREIAEKFGITRMAVYRIVRDAAAQAVVVDQKEFLRETAGKLIQGKSD